MERVLYILFMRPDVVASVLVSIIAMAFAVIAHGIAKSFLGVAYVTGEAWYWLGRGCTDPLFWASRKLLGVARWVVKL